MGHDQSKLSKNKNYARLKIMSILISLICLAFFIFTIKNIIIETGLFLICLVFMVKWGQFVMLDVDPLPLSALLLLHLYDMKVSLLFTLLSLPIIDIFSSRFNYYSLINLASLTFTVIIISVFPLGSLVLGIGIIIFNVIRTLISLILGLGPQTLIYNVCHAVIYFVLASLISFFV